MPIDDPFKAFEKEAPEEESAEAQDVSTYSYVAELPEHSQPIDGMAHQKPAPLWLVTFTDAIALMLTFFVLLYAMSVPKEDEWIGFSEGLSSKFGQYEGRPYNSGSQDVISINRVQPHMAQNLTYLRNLITNLLRSRNIEDVLLIEQDKRLIISLPSELLFASGESEVGIEGKKVLFALTGILSRIKNKVGVVGHTDPDPINGSVGGYRTNWELSLGRSAAVANVLKDVGYDKTLTVQGVAGGRFEELPDTIPQEKRYDMSRRVDIVIYDNDGYRQNAFDTP